MTKVYITIVLTNKTSGNAYTRSFPREYKGENIASGNLQKLVFRDVKKACLRGEKMIAYRYRIAD